MRAAELEFRNLRWAWVGVAALVGYAALRWVTPLDVLAASAIAVFGGLLLFRTETHQDWGIRLASVGSGMMVPAWPALVLEGVNAF
ncbi:hypothetical protein EEB14_17230 [Rhodococcus sp. WS4]|nr:hypothetical protein EEB14_17230 [Rhodococcus sp. WS4]